MPAITTPGIVLRFANYRDHDRMLTLLSPRLGRVDLLSRGCRRPKSPLMPASELFVSGEFVLFLKNERAVLTSCALQDTFYPLRLDPYRLTCASYMAGLCAAAVQPASPLRTCMPCCSRGCTICPMTGTPTRWKPTTAFVLLFADATGYRPRLSRCAHCRTPLDVSGGGHMDIAAGGLCCPACASRATFPVTHEQIVWMSRTIREGLTPQKNTGAGMLFDMLRRYVRKPPGNAHQGGPACYHERVWSVPS